jgi:predicted transcriptional regulator
MANITLKVDDDLIKKARYLAAEKKTSINAIIREKIEEFISQDLKKEAALKGLDSFFIRCRSRVGTKTWTRDQVHER